jgi:bifunctional ADP-heptose synthase (sugar kinase/adenylyltransferase)
MTDFDKLFEDFKNIKACVVGDVMLDTYWWGHVERISPEAPVPVVNIERREYRIGGAGNVALNLSSLDARVSVFSVTGNDDDGKILENLLQQKGIHTGYLLKNEDRITTNKTRIFGRNQQMMRLDSETTKDLSDADFSYKGVDLFKPNLKEVREGLNLLVQQLDLLALREIHNQLAGRLEHRISFITLSEKGVFCQIGEEAKIIPSYLRSVADVSGAGDTVIAVAALVYATTQNVNLMAEIANIAGGLVCEEVGTVAISRGRLLEECKLLLNSN